MKEELLLMNTKERARKVIIKFVEQGYLTVKKAAKRMQLTSRQTRRILRSYERYGDKSLMHGNRRKSSN
jgi:transposase